MKEYKLNSHTLNASKIFCSLSSNIVRLQIISHMSNKDHILLENHFFFPRNMQGNSNFYRISPKKKKKFMRNISVGNYFTIFSVDFLTQSFHKFFVKNFFKKFKKFHKNFSLNNEKSVEFFLKIKNKK